MNSARGLVFAGVGAMTPAFIVGGAAQARSPESAPSGSPIVWVEQTNAAEAGSGHRWLRVLKSPRSPQWLCIALALILFTWPELAGAQLAPTGGHYAGRPSDTGFEPGAVNASGGYTASVPLNLPAARGALPMPLQIISGARGVGAAGLGWDIPFSYVRRDTTYQHRRPALDNDVAPKPREKVFVSLQGRILDFVRKGADWVARHDAPELVLREQNGTWLLYDGRGLTWTFTAPSPLAGAGLWLLSSVAGPGGNRVQLDYDVGTPLLPGDVPVHGVSMDLVRISYNIHPTVGCPKNEIVLIYGPIETSPLSMSMLGDVTLARMHTLLNVDVTSRPDCGASAERLRRYEFSYLLPDADTRQPRLNAVQMFGRQTTAEENTAVPIATYAYGSASNGGKLIYQKTQSIPLPAGADSTKISSTEVEAVNLPDGLPVGYNTWQSLTDVTGDGRPDLIYQNAGKLWVARNVPAADGLTMWGPVGELHDATFASGAFETRGAFIYPFVEI
jgi:hypothetical protein